jgi:sugar diacid utilization regulator
LSIRLRQILKLPTLKDLKLVAGEAGLDKTVRWIYIAECIGGANEIVDWIISNELVFITGYGLKEDTNALLDLITLLNTKSISGVIINIGPYIRKIPSSVIALADELALPLLELPWEAKLVDVTRDICNEIILADIKESRMESFLENLLFQYEKVGSDLSNQALDYGFDIAERHIVGIIGITDSIKNLKRHDTSNDQQFPEIHKYLLRTAKVAFSSYSINALTVGKYNSVIFLIKYNEYIHSILPTIIEEIRNDVKRMFPCSNIVAGFGRSYQQMSDLEKSYREADQALQVARCDEQFDGSCFYDDLDIYLLLMKIDDKQFLVNYYNQIFMALIEYDRSTDSHLMQTFEAFLNSNCNMDKTSSRLFIHKNTLTYRLSRIEKLLNIDLHDLNQRVKYAMGFRVGRLINLHR